MWSLTAVLAGVLLCFQHVSGRDDFIVNGAPLGESDSYTQHMAWLEVGGTLRCTGVVIGHASVITSTYCVQGLSAAEITVHVGDFDRTVTHACDFASPVSYMITDKSGDGIVILRLPTSVLKSGCVTAIPIASSPPAHKTLVAVLGWGDMKNAVPSQTVRLANVRYFNEGFRACDNYYKSVNVEGVNYACMKTLKVNLPYAGGCHGDGGGAVVFQGRLIGIIFKVPSGCADTESSRWSLLVNLPQLLPWIVSTLGCELNTIGHSVVVNDFNPSGNTKDKETLPANCNMPSCAECTVSDSSNCAGTGSNGYACSDTSNQNLNYCSPALGLLCRDRRQGLGCRCCNYQLKVYCYN